MPISLLPSFLLYCYTGAITPGPANLCSLSTALRYGKGPALRQWRGLFAGFFLVSMVSVLAAYFLGALLNPYVGYLSWLGAAYLLWLAWHTLRSSEGPADGTAARPSFLTGLLVQLTNVKIMIFCLVALTSYVLPYDGSFGSLLLAGLFLPFTGPVANLIWLFAGAALQRFFTNHRRAVDTVMAAALALCAVSLVWPHGRA
ncbi:MAG: LysE family transporter [Oscillibacter sp.]|nr:LysE family transporter [Oscillibacter sp.]